MTTYGVGLALIGAFFLFMKPALSPEDARFLGSFVEQINDAVPALAAWLRRVSWVMDGFMVTAGTLVIYIARSAIPSGDGGAILILVLAGVTSIGLISAINFMIRSNFRWALLGLDGVWALGILLAVIAG